MNEIKKKFIVTKKWTYFLPPDDKNFLWSHEKIKFFEDFSLQDLKVDISGPIKMSIFRSSKKEFGRFFCFFIGTLFGLIDLLNFELKENNYNNDGYTPYC